MYAGTIVESGSSDQIFYEPRHPYTWGLQMCIRDRIGAVFSNREIIAGVVDSRHRVVSRASLALGAGCDYRETARLVADCACLLYTSRCV